MNNDDAEKFWEQVRQKNAHLIGESTSESRERRLEDENSFLNRTYPNRSSIEEAYLEPDQSILVVITTNEFEEGRDTSTVRSERFSAVDEGYQELFARHKFKMGQERHHWIVRKFDEILGEGWGSEL